MGVYETKDKAVSFEVNVPKRLCPLDILMDDPGEVTQEDSVKRVEFLYNYLSQWMRDTYVGSGERHTEMHDIFVDQKTGMVHRLAILPSDLTKEVGWTVAQFGIKPAEGVDGLLNLEQKEREYKWQEMLAKVTASYFYDHGYGAGLPAEQPVVDALAHGDFVDSNSEPIVLTETDLMIQLMTKGSGKTLVGEKKQKELDRPNYDMDATYAQLAEAMIHIERSIATDLFQYYRRPDVAQELAFNIRHFYDRESPVDAYSLMESLINITELWQGTWLSNRTAVTRGHSMGGWEVIRAYLGDTHARFTEGMYKYAVHLRRVGFGFLTELDGKRNVMMRDWQRIVGDQDAELMQRQIKGISGQWADFTQAVHDMETPYVVEERTDSATNSPTQKKVKLGQLASIRMRSPHDVPAATHLTPDDYRRYLRYTLYDRFPNVIWEAITPLMYGVNPDGSIFENLNDEPENHTFLSTVGRAPGLRLLLGLQSIHDVGGKVGFAVGDQIGLVQSGLNYFVPENAFGCNPVRGTHKVGLRSNLKGVVLDDKVLKLAQPVVSPDTVLEHSIRPRTILLPTGEVRVLSALRIHGAQDDTVLNVKQMRTCGQAMVQASEADLDSLYQEHPKAGHYLPKEVIEKIWTEIIGRSRAIKSYRDIVTHYLADRLTVRRTSMYATQ